jgi:D-3-phosphoglycerate dehydrogenase
MRLGKKGVINMVQGTVTGNKEKRIVQFDAYRTFIPTEGDMVIAVIDDKPNIIGPCCVVLGEGNINIGSMHVGRMDEGQPQLMVLSVDQMVPDDIMKRLLQVPGVKSAKMVEL